MTFLEAKKIVEDKGYHVVKNSEDETFRQRVAREELEEAMEVVKRAGLKVINEFTDLSYEDYRDIVKEHLIRMGLQPDVANENIMSYAESIEENYNNEIDAVDTAQEVYDSNMDESCCCGGGKKKKDKKKGKKSDFVPFWAKKKDKVDEALEDDLDLEGMTLDEAITLDEGFGTAGGTPLSQLCADYIRDDYFTKLANEVGLEVAKAEFLEKAQEVTGDKYYKTLSARIQAAKTATAVLFVLQGTMFGGSNMDLAAGTRQSAYHRNRR